MIQVFFDGGFADETAVWGNIFYENGVRTADKKYSNFRKGLTSNISEYFGIITALYAIANNIEKWKDKPIEIVGDSLLIISQVNGDYKTKNTDLLPLNNLARTILNDLRQQGLNITIKWVGRESNHEADRLCRS